MNFDRREFLRLCASSSLGAGVSLSSRDAKAFIWLAGIVAEALEGFLVRTVVTNTVRAGIGAMSRASVARIAASRTALTAGGYAARSPFAGLYKGAGGLFAQGSGAVAEAIFKALAPGFGVVPGVGRSIGREPDIGYAEFPNSEEGDTPTPNFGASDLSCLSTIARFIQKDQGWGDHQAACAVYPIELLEAPRYDGTWNSLSPAVYNSAAGTIRIICIGIGTPNPRFHCRVTRLRGSDFQLDETMFLPPSFEQVYPQ